MKTAGLLGGMSWESTIPYYRSLNQAIGARLGGLNSAKILLHSVNFAEIEALQSADRWDDAGRLLGEAAAGLQRAGADFIVLCTNTMHRVAPAIEAAASVPLLHIADATAARIKAAGLQTVGLLGTRFTMEQPFYRERLAQRHGLRVVVPENEARTLVHRVIYDELCRGQLREDSRAAFRRVIDDLVQQGAQGVILGCTEIALLVSPNDAQVELFDTASLHAEHAARFALGEV